MTKQEKAEQKRERRAFWARLGMGSNYAAGNNTPEANKERAVRYRAADYRPPHGLPLPAPSRGASRAAARMVPLLALAAEPPRGDR